MSVCMHVSVYLTCAAVSKLCANFTWVDKSKKSCSFFLIILNPVKA